MYEWSKEIVKKISDSGCLNASELRSTEVALRACEVVEGILEEASGFFDSNEYELEHKM